jgi:hypothetical protein
MVVRLSALNTGRVRLEGLCKLEKKKKSNGFIENRTCDSLARSTVPQQISIQRETNENVYVHG